MSESKGATMARAELERLAEGGGTQRTVVDLFSGIGGFSLGLQRSGGFSPIAFYEIDSLCRHVLKKWWPNAQHFHDVRSLDTEQIAGLGAVDAITFGFPCQDLSLAGNGAGLSGARSSLFWEAIRALRLVRPRIALMENVAALLGRGMGSVLGALAETGYDAEWDCIRAFDVGRPHVRDRLFLVAYTPGDGWGPGRPGGLADGLAGVPVEPCWSGDPVASFEERFAQPALLGVDDGISGGLDRIGAVGNALLPQIPELIGRSLIAQEGASHV